MSNLAQQPITLCHKDTPALTPEEQARLLAPLQDWEVIVENGVSKLRRTYFFTDYVSAQAFALQVGELAEAANHHPAILIEWGRATVSWWTHTIAGLHSNDFIMAARCDDLV